MQSASRVRRYALVAGFAVLAALSAVLGYRLLSANERAAELERALQRSRGDVLLGRAEVLRLEGQRPEALALVRAAASGVLGSEVSALAAYQLTESLVIPAITLTLPESYTPTRLDFEVSGLHLVARDTAGAERAWHARTGAFVSDRPPSPLLPPSRPPAGQRAVEREGFGLAMAQGSVVRVHTSNGGVRRFDLSPADIRSVELTRAGDALLLGDERGRIGRLPLDGSEAAWWPVMDRPVALLAPLAGDPALPGEVVVMDDDGALRTWREPEAGATSTPGDALPALPEAAQSLFQRRSGALVAVTPTEGVFVLEPSACGSYRGSCLEPRWRRIPLAPEPPVRLSAFSPEADRLALLRGDSLVLMDLDYGLPIAPSPRGGAAAAFAQDASGRVLALATESELVIVDARVDPPRTATHAIAKTSPEVVVSEDGSLVVLTDGSERLLAVRTDTPNGLLHWTLPRAPRYVALTGHGEEVVYRASEGGFHRWDTGTQAERGFGLSGSDDPPARGFIVAGSDRILVWDSHRVALCAVGDVSCAALAPLPGGDIEHAGASDDGSHVFTLHTGGGVAVFDARGVPVATLDDQGAVESVSMAAGGASLFLYGADGSSRLLGLPAGRRLANWPAGPVVFDGPPGAPSLFTGDGAFWLSVVSSSEFSVGGVDARTGRALPSGPAVSTAHLGRALPVQAWPLPGRPAIVAWDGVHASVIEVMGSGHRREWLRVPLGRPYVTADGSALVSVSEWVRRIDVHGDPAALVRATAALTNHRVCEACMEPVVVPPEQLSDPVWAPSALCSCP